MKERKPAVPGSDQEVGTQGVTPADPLEAGVVVVGRSQAEVADVPEGILGEDRAAVLAAAGDLEGAIPGGGQDIVHAQELSGLTRQVDPGRARLGVVARDLGQEDHVGPRELGVALELVQDRLAVAAVFDVPGHDAEGRGDLTGLAIREAIRLEDMGNVDRVSARREVARPELGQGAARNEGRDLGEQGRCARGSAGEGRARGGRGPDRGAGAGRGPSAARAAAAAGDEEAHAGPDQREGAGGARAWLAEESSDRHGWVPGRPEGLRR